MPEAGGIDNSRSIVAQRYNYGDDCSSCRLVSGVGIIGMGIYVLTAAKKQKTVFSRNFIYCVSAGVIGLGAARLLALPPFQRTTSE
ncbi:uncharacterized protein LOC116351801 [Contarinia nasturtii]|uniref:uncharacterized protein LOC116351801 n=1 Tax=Contarinia nasturtii TaxID=265458 RepID=UPI0012D4440D|nr:uncharacterized protein LOC116351801 [Contarinia nasturtii]